MLPPLLQKQRLRWLQGSVEGRCGCRPRRSHMQAMTRPTRPGLMRAQHARSLPQVLSTEVQQLALGELRPSPWARLRRLSGGGLVLTHAKTPSRPLSIHVSIYPSAPALAMRAPSYPDLPVPNPPDLPQPSCPNLTPTLLPRPSCPNPPCTPSCTALLPRYVRLPYHPRPRHVARPHASHNQKQREAERSERP